MIPFEIVFVLLPIQTVPQPDTPSYVKIRSGPSHEMPYQTSASCPNRTHWKTYHHPCPSNTTPQGSPTSLLQPLNRLQYTLSRCQKQNPPRNTLSPTAIIIHILPKISQSLLPCARLTSFSRPVIPLPSLPSNLSSAILNRGLSVISITYIALSNTTAVKIANAI